MLIAFGDSRTFTEGNFSTSGPPLFLFPQNFTPRDAHCFWQSKKPTKKRKTEKEKEDCVRKAEKWEGKCDIQNEK